jgi:hypothetical protein
MKYVYLLGSVIIACGLAGFGYFSSKNMTESSRLIEVRGLSEKVVKADVGSVFITISNENANLEELCKKRASDKEKVIGFLKSCGATSEEIVDSSMDTTEREEEDKTTSGGVTTTKKRKYYKSDDRLTVQTKDLEKINKIKEEIVKLSSEGILATYSYSYNLANFLDIKEQMMKEASENAKKSAEAFVEPYGQKVGEVVYLRQGEITIRAENEAEDVNRWNSVEEKSVNKKLRLVVRAGFSKDRCKKK